MHPLPGERSGTNLTIKVDGTGNFQLEKATTLGTTLTNVGAASTTGTFTAPTDGAAGFFRVQKL